MKHLFLTLMIGISIVMLNAYSQVKPKKNEKSKANSTETITKCEPNQDISYNRVETLKKLGAVLGETTNKYYNANYRIKMKPAKNPKYVLNDERPNGFFVYDLTDISNNTLTFGKCIEFIDKHIYHFANSFTPYSFSHIAILEEGSIKIFKAVNCEDDDRIEEVIKYLDERLKNDESKSEIIKRVRDYRKYGVYGAIDSDSIGCKEVR